MERIKNKMKLFFKKKTTSWDSPDTITLCVLVLVGLALFLASSFLPIPQNQKLPLFFLALGLFAPYILFASPFFLTKIQNWSRLWGPVSVLLPLIMLVVYVFLAPHGESFVDKGFWFFGGYIGLPALFSGILWKSKGRITFWDFLLMLWIWYPVEFHLLPRFHYPSGGSIRLPLHFFMALLPAIYLFLVSRDFAFVGYSYHLQKKDFLWILGSLAAISLTVIPLGLALDFLKWNPHFQGIAATFGIFIGIFFLTALPEEFLFRGLLHQMIDHWLGKPRYFILPLLISSIFFGLCHWNNGHPQPNWNYVILATIAGFFYGMTYLKSKSIVASALVHASVNTLWALFFHK
ncbi:MAG: CPBP family intramembrane metalloprotease [Planctomycetota bacterium]|nr:MAG: CPBP family intramembrane metalloprotease [Planctomycetota bacterium]